MKRIYFITARKIDSHDFNHLNFFQLEDFKIRNGNERKKKFYGTRESEKKNWKFRKKRKKLDWMEERDGMMEGRLYS